MAEEEGGVRREAADEGGHMRKLIVGILVAGLLGGTPAFADDHVDSGNEVGMALGAAALNLGYFPAKVLIAIGGLAVGAVAGVLTGGDQRAAYGVWVPAASGTYIVKPAHLAGEAPLEFFGTDYADRPSTNVLYGEPTMAADAVYRAH
jgi:hypothetical protein